MKSNVFNYTAPEFHQKGWGYELWLTNNGLYCGKLLHFNAGKRCSYHYHKLKSEHFYILKGAFRLKLGWDDNYDKAEEHEIFEGVVLEIPVGLRHQMIALPDSDIIEISTQHFEDDSFRVIKGD